MKGNQEGNDKLLQNLRIGSSGSWSSKISWLELKWEIIIFAHKWLVGVLFWILISKYMLMILVHGSENTHLKTNLILIS